jgi:hypothetical protein
MGYPDSCAGCGESYDSDNLMTCTGCGREFCYRCGDGISRCDRCLDPPPAAPPAENAVCDRAQDPPAP